LYWFHHDSKIYFYYQNWQLNSLDSSVANSNSDSEEKISLSNSKPSSLPPTPCKRIEHGIILKQLVLKGISSQLITAQVTYTQQYNQ
jgi:hypothetical protein